VKGIVMAGGTGSRLKPLTYALPKPMVPMINRPIMEYTVELLKKYEIDNIGVTLQYLPEVIRDYFGDGSDWGVDLHYFLEEVPLGTAGSVKNAGRFLDETFVVVSGDALTDIDIGKAVKFHKRKKAIATLILKRVEVPLDYGVVVTDEEGLITRFLEKPSWGELFSDTANTGIYILEPEVLDYIEYKQKFDFSQNLFPMLLSEKQPMYGYVTDDYWCDIGNPKTYMQANYDMLNDLVNYNFSAIKLDGGIRVENKARIAQTATIEGPCYIGNHARIESYAHIAPFTVVGDFCIVGEHSFVEKSILWKNSVIGKRADIRGAIICKDVYVENNVSIGEGAVIGDKCCLNSDCVIKPDVRLWPGKSLEHGTVAQSSIIWGNGIKRSLFGGNGISGKLNTDIDPQFAVRLGASLGAYLKPGKRVGISCDQSNAASMLKHAFLSGMISTGLDVYDLKQLTTSILRYAVRRFSLDAGVHIYSDQNLSDVHIQIINGLGANLLPSIERQIENLFMQEDFQRVQSCDLAQLKTVSDTISLYSDMLINSTNIRPISIAGPKILLCCGQGVTATVLSGVLDKIGCSTIHLDKDDFYNELKSGRSYDLACIINADGEEVRLYDFYGERVRKDVITALTGLFCLKYGIGGNLVVPYDAPDIMEQMAKGFKRKVIRTKTCRHAVMEEMLKTKSNNGIDTNNAFMMYFDGSAFLIKIIEIMCLEQKNIAQLISSLPKFYMVEKAIKCPWTAKGRVIRSLIEEGNKNGSDLELFEGIKIKHAQGWALVLPDSDQPVCRVYSEGFSEEYAEELCKLYEDKIARLTGC